jgi:beta-mannosidase
MFSCATYPATPDFLAEVAKEVTYQVQRLRDHPCLAIWCGNNEDLGAIRWYEESRANPARYIVDYDRLNEGTIGRLVRKLDPHRPWWPSSPSAGPGNYADNWHADGSGDMHYWSVWHEGKPFSAYLEVQPRFCSEFGFQSLPSAQVAAGFAGQDQRNLTSPVMEHHQRHPRGNEIILGTMLRYFRMPGSWEETLYLSQVQQALAIRTAVDWWRSTMPRCMGILYWQLNDVWPCASWSSLEYGGRWKILHHEARRFFAPVSPVLVVKDGMLLVSIVNDSPGTWAGQLELRILDFAGQELEKQVVPVAVEPVSAPRLLELDIENLPAPVDSCFCVAELTGSVSTGKQLIPRAWTFLTEPKRCSLVKPGLQVKAEVNPDGTIALHLSSDAPAFWLSLDVPVQDPTVQQGSAQDRPVQDGPASLEPRGEFDDAGFLLLPGEPKTLVYHPALGEKARNPEDFAHLIVCRHL